MIPFRKEIAPVDVIQKDFELLRNSVNLRTTNEIQDVLFMQSIEGRAHNGAGFFNKRTYVNTTIDDVVHALNRDPESTQQMRQALIDDIVEFVHAVINGEKRDRLMNVKGEPFLGFPLFRDRKVNARDVLRGLYMGGLRDNAEIRKETEVRYHSIIGCGQCYLVNTRIMEKMGLDGEKLAHEAHEEELEFFEEKKLILGEHESVEDQDDEYRYYYIRHRLGHGQSDDAAIIVAGILYNVDVALGVFISDAIDTLEKYVAVYHDQDQELAYFIGRAFPDLGITMDDVYELSDLCSIPEAEHELVPDSSLRYLMSIDDSCQLSTMEVHLNFIEGKPIPAFPISFKQILNTQFYKYIKKRLLNVRRIDALTIPDIAVQDVNVPIKGFAQKNCIVVNEDELLSDVVTQFKAQKCEIIVITGKRGKVIGTLDAEDLISLTST